MRRLLIVLTLAGAALLGAASLNAPRVAHAQFIDRVVRPCAAGGVPLASVIVNPNNTGNVNVTPCTGGSLTVNGVAIIPGPAVPGGSNTQVQYNDTGTLAGSPALTYTKAATSQLVAVVPTWNSAGTTFTALRVNATDTASAVGSVLLNLSTSGTTLFQVDKFGNVTDGGGWSWARPNARLSISTSANGTPLTLSGYSLLVADASPGLSLTGTWNTSGAPAAVFVNITNTASGAAAKLMDLQIGSASRFSVAKSGVITSGSAAVSTGGLTLAHASSAFTTTIQPGVNVTASRVYIWPTNFGSAGGVLTDAAGNGTLSWAVPTPGIAGSGTLNTLAKFTPNGTTLGDSQITDDGTTVSIPSLGTFAKPLGTAGLDAGVVTGSDVTAIGDVFGNSTGTQVKVDALAQTITATASTESLAIDGVAHTVIASAATAINLDSKTGVTTIGDVGGVGNSTYLMIDDPNSQILARRRIVPAVTGIPLGSAPLPWGSLLVGNAANNSSQITGTFTANQIATLPDATGTILLDTTAGNLSGTTGSIGGGLLTAGTCASGTVAVTNSTTSMTVSVSPNTYPGDGDVWYGYVSSNGTVTVKVCAIVALTPTASTYNVRVIR